MIKNPPVEEKGRAAQHDITNQLDTQSQIQSYFSFQACGFMRLIGRSLSRITRSLLLCTTWTFQGTWTSRDDT